MGAWKDVRYGLRLIRRGPGFAAVAIAALALGIGANTAIFSIVNTVLLRPLPYPGAERIGLLWENNPGQGWQRIGISGPNFVDYRERTHSFEELAVLETGSGTINGLGAEPIQAPGLRVTTNFFTLLGQKPLLGRDFFPSEGKENRVVILTYGAWQRFHGGNPAVIGKRLTLDGLPYTVIGVMAPTLWLPVPSDAFVPFANGDLRRMDRQNRECSVMAKLKPGVTWEQASHDANAVLHGIAAAYPRMQYWNASITPLQETLAAGVRPALLLLLGAVGLVLLIACANIANLLLARATGRARETAIRTALGASRTRLIRQWLTETMVLGAVGGALGLLLALWGVDLLDRLLPMSLRLTESTSEILRPHLVIDRVVLLFTAAVSLATGLVFGAAPALAVSRTGAADALKEGGRTSASRHHRRIRDAFVVAEIALALMLLICASLTIKSFWKVQHVNAGFDPHQLLTMMTELPTDSRYQKDAEKVAFYERVLENLKRLPGVQSASLVNAPPLGGNDPKMGFSIEGRPLPPSGQNLPARYRSIGEDYFATMRIPLLRGRFFTEQDRMGNPNAAIIDEVTAAHYWPAGVEGAADPIGQKIRMGNTVAQIVGIVGAVHSGGLDKDPVPTVYFTYRQSPESLNSFVIRHPHPNGLIGAAKRAVYAVDRQQPLFQVQTMDEIVSGSQSAERFTLGALLIFAVVALVLAAIGIYGVISYTVAQRRNEIGIRIALGASTGDVVRLVVGQGMTLAGFGLAGGLVAAAAASRVVAALLHGVSPHDPAIFAGTAAILGGVALLASWLPARMATRIDPIVSLRYE
jgi:putative ABC transport system permease protein